MTYMSIYCGYCGKRWEVYQRDNWKDERARTCPHCFHEIDAQTWERDVLPAFGAALDCNAELFKNHKGSIFAVDFIGR